MILSTILRFETEPKVCWILPADALDVEVLARAKRVQTAPLDVPAEIARYGADIRGGVSIPV